MSPKSRRMENEQGEELVPLYNKVRIGWIELQSNEKSIEDLCKLAEALLKRKTIRKYLDLIKQEEVLHSSMTG